MNSVEFTDFLREYVEIFCAKITILDPSIYFVRVQEVI